jgi:hypothetical protein
MIDSFCIEIQCVYIMSYAKCQALVEDKAEVCVVESCVISIVTINRRESHMFSEKKNYEKKS